MKAFHRLIAVVLVAAFALSACAPAAAPTQAPQTDNAQPAATKPAADNSAAAAPTEAAPATTDNSAAAPSGEAANLTWWVDTTGDSTTAQCMIEQAADTFNATNKDNIKVEGVLQANAWDAIRTAVAGGAGPDIVYTPGPSYAYQMAAAGQLLPLDDYATKEGWSDQFVPWALSLGKVNGKLYSIPNEIETMILYYNKTVFEKNGWTAPKTMDEWFDLMKKVKDAGMIPLAGGNSEWKPTDEWWATIFLNEYAGSENVYKALKGEMKWTDPVFVEAINKLNEAMKAGYWQGGLDRYYTATQVEYLAALGDGKAAMMASGSWALGDMHKYFGDEAGNTNEWAWTPIPSKSGTPSFDLGIGSTYSINAATKYPDAAAKFLTYFFSDEIQANIISKCGVAPAPVKMDASLLKDVDARRADLITQLNDAASQGNYGYTTWTFWPAKSDAYIYDEIEKVWAGDKTTEDYLKGLQDTFDQELKDGVTLPIPERQ